MTLASLVLLLWAALPWVGGTRATGASPAADELPKVGAPAPDFSLADQDGCFVTRDSLHGKTVVLAFYPKDFTPG